MGLDNYATLDRAEALALAQWIQTTFGDTDEC